MDSMPTIIPVASGKGGVGKSFLAANLAIALAKMNRKVIAVDLDLGGANLHSFLGLKNRRPGIGEFLRAKKKSGLAALVAPTGIDHLGLLAGDAATPFMANIAHEQKRRLIDRIRTLPADYVLLDLSSGTAFNTLDFFRLSPFGLLVTTPEHPAVKNLMTFLKQFLLRAVDRAFANRPAIRKLLWDEFRRPPRQQVESLTDLKAKISSVEPSAGEKTATLLAQIRPRVVFNRCRRRDDLNFTDQMDADIAESLSIAVDYFGFVSEDGSVSDSVSARQPHLLSAPESPAAAAVVQTARWIEEDWETPVPDSARRIRNQMEQR